MMRKLVLSTATTLGFNVGSKRASLQFGVILFVLLLLAPISGAYALALADIELSSRLNEPLNARIPLRAFLATDMQTIQAGLADDRHFSRAGLERSSILSLLQFTTIRNQDGSAYIRITTDAPIDESFLSFIVEVNWSRGRILREYTLLLDPPVYVDTGSAMVAPIKEVAATADTTGAAKPSTSGSTPEKSTERVRVSSQSTSGRSDGTNVS
ncbi:MAG: hypothetical protein KJO08_05635, partial [Gammaproteobacteria bacterium]|nr:hypothetical protein [Gammaproteobacteria bacterium]NNJ84802.1 hypothetical protein [Gammaproteobacteria bacterium]